MIIITLKPIERQQFNITLDGVRFDITLVAVQNGMCATIMRDDTVLISGIRCIAGYPLLPYRHLEGDFGNFAFQTQNNELPWWESFGSSQQLIYLSATELAELRG